MEAPARRGATALGAPSGCEGHSCTRKSHGRPEGCVHRGARSRVGSSGSDLRGADQRLRPGSCRCLKLFCSASFWRRLPNQAPAAVAAAVAGSAKSGKGTKEASYLRCASADCQRTGRELDKDMSGFFPYSPQAGAHKHIRFHHCKLDRRPLGSVIKVFFQQHQMCSQSWSVN